LEWRPEYVDPDLLQHTTDAVPKDVREDAVEQLIATTHDAGDYRTSMHLDRLAGRAMEVDAIIAEPIRQAEAAGCTDLPRMIALRDVLQAVDGAVGRSQ